MATRIISKLREIRSNAPGIRQEIAFYILNLYSRDEEIKGFFRNLFSHGCVSGMVGSMVYYVDTHAFFDRHYDEIEELRHELENDLGTPIRIEHDLKNELAWFGFEEIARRLVNELGIE